MPRKKTTLAMLAEIALSSSDSSASEVVTSDLSGRERESNSVARILCSCGCRRWVDVKTERRHWENKAANAPVGEMTKAAFRNASPEPAFKGARPAKKRAGSRSRDPRPVKRAKAAKSKGGEQLDGAADTAAPLAEAEPNDSQPAASSPGSANDQDGALIEEIVQPVEREEGGGAANGDGDDGEHCGHASEAEDDERPNIESYTSNRYRATVSDELEGVEDSDSDVSSVSDSSSGSSSSGVLDEFSDSDSDGAAWDQLGEIFEAHVAALDAMDGLTDEDLEVLRAFSYKVEKHLTRDAYESLPDYFPDVDIATYERNRAHMYRLSGLRPTLYDCCQNSCVLFVGQHADLDACPVCACARRDGDGRPVQRFSYLPLIPRLKAMFRNAESSERQLYRAEATATHQDGQYNDIFDGAHYRGLLDKLVRIDGKTQAYKYFADLREVALGLFTDGFAPFKKRKQTCWPLLLVNYNLDPEVRYRKENIISLGAIPGPKQPTDFNSFLYPLVQELLELARGVSAFDGKENCLFTLRAYLLLGCGDMPAVAKLMCMKGHSGLYSCRFCKIRGVPIPGARGNALYTPLDRSTHPDAGDIPCYDPAALPLRTHQEMLQQALEVESATGTRAQKLSRDYGINGMSILAVLPSIRLDTSFPIEFMHLVWLNLVPNLILLYTGKYKDLDVGAGDYELAAAVWEEIGKITAASGSTIPSAFDARVPNVAKDKSHMIAETWGIWTLHIAPIVLRGRFEKPKYYDHFMELVSLLRLCVQLELTSNDIDKIRTGFQAWVKKFEKYFYQYDPDRLATCVTTVHGLLHIADSIEKMGPVGCYWSFLMERFCSSLRPAIKSRRNPYASIDRYIVDRALIDQVRLFNSLNSHNRPFDEVARPVKKGEYQVGAYPVSVLMHPQRNIDLASVDRNRIARHLSVRFGGNAKSFLKYVPEKIESWGKVRRLDGGDTVHAREMVKLRRTDRDMSFVRYALEVDKYKNRPKQKPVFVRKEYFGQLQYIYVLPLPALPQYNQNTPQTLLLASVQDCADLQEPNNVGIRYYRGKLSPPQVIDLASIECVVGRVVDRGHTAIIDRTNEFSRVIIPELDS